MKRIVVFKSSTGFTAKYAGWIAEELGCEAVELKKVNLSELQNYDEVIYGGWIMANMVSGYNKISQLNLKKVIVFGVGMSVAGDEVVTTIAGQNNIPKENFFYFEGGYNPKKVSFLKKMMMNMIKKSIENKEEKTKEDIHMLETFKGADNTKREYINPLIDFFQTEKSCDIL